VIGARLARAAVLATLVAGCDQPAPSAKPLVVATFYPLYEFARQVAGDRAAVLSLVPPGVEPHDWEPSPQQVADVQKARVFVYNGAGFEPWADKLLRDVRGGNALAVDTSKGLPLLPAPVAALDAHGHAPKPAAAGTPSGSPDPHVWLDPMLAQSQVEAIRGALVQADPANRAAYEDNARTYRAKLADLDARFQAGLAKCARRDIVVSHASFGYLARRYGLTQIGLMGLAPEAEPSPAELVAIANAARRRGVTTIFFETLVSPRLAETLAREIGARTLVLNPIEGLTKEDVAAGKDYVALMQDNLASLRAGLQCK
jgi:zinc transport system substrate-binding protein